MRKISAHYIFPVNSTPIKNGIVIIDNTNKIVDIIETKGKLKETSGIEFYNGVIVPGFINTHCHIELSYLKEVIPKHTGHPEFIKQIVTNIKKLDFDGNAAINATKEMLQEGIVAVGDISNNEESAEIKNNSELYFHTFIELADFFNPNYGKSKIKEAKIFQKSFKNSSIVPHAPYTCSPDFIQKTAELSENVFSIHNQETQSEDEMYISESGEILEMMRERNLIFDFNPTKKSALKSYFDKIARKNLNILLIHNIFSTNEDIKYAENLSKNIYWTLCPNSNKYIQNKLPDINKFIKNNCKITLGTDSLATNDRLSIIEEMKNFSDVDFANVLEWATLNGAKALKVDNKYGSIEIGKQPGLNLITNFDFEKMQLTEGSFVKKLV